MQTGDVGVAEIRRLSVQKRPGIATEIKESPLAFGFGGHACRFRLPVCRD
jgi:hypothetical protein